jgi:CRP/FNR family transcriptional regulator, cyclic AMP receptor protein
MSDTRVVEQLYAGVPLFKGLGSGQRSRLSTFTTIRRYRPGAVIVREGDTSMSFYVVLSGAVRVEHSTDSGPAMPIAELRTGGFFGEMGLIDDLPRSATVVAMEPTECALMVKWDFQNALRDDPEIALALLPVLHQRIRDLEARLAHGTQLSVEPEARAAESSRKISDQSPALVTQFSALTPLSSGLNPQPFAVPDAAR